MASSQNPLSQIQSFKDLVRKLEDDLGWPLQDYGFDDLTFEYQPSELGLKEEEAAKIKSIHQLRPLEDGQPWGIFFIEFEKKKLPIVVLRRVLNHLVIKKRASASKADQKAWHAKDLLFISAYGNEGSSDRELAFAHFHEEQGDKPTLRVLDWDGSDTPLKLAHVEATLKSKLQWPRDTNNKEQWRKDWSGAFKHRPGYVITKSDELAEALAGLAKRICAATMTLMKAESEKGKLRKLYNAFKEALLHDLTEDGFADTYAQTITYGLLTAAISRTSGGLVADDLPSMVPVTNPFLKEMLETFLTAGGRKGGLDFDELGVQDVVDLLRGPETDLPQILRDFGNKASGEDPVIHFYEHFLSAYNKKLKIERGVFYTPRPVVSYIVRSVHELLQTEFGLEDGLAATETWDDMQRKDPSIQVPLGSVVNARTNQATMAPIDPFTPFVQILDPATGTGTFLVEVIDVIHKTMEAKWTKLGHNEAKRRELWNSYVPVNLLPRLYGYELMMAPYAIAHMKIGLKLYETGYRFGSEERARIYLTSSLEPPQDFSDRLEFDAPALAHEAQAVNEVKRFQIFTVVIGNPPYSKVSSNTGDWIHNLLRGKVIATGETTDSFYHINGESIEERNPKWLNDDYIKFMRFAQWRIKQSGYGVLGFITNHGYLDNPTFRAVRHSLLTTFNSIHFVNLHGRVGEDVPQGTRDENVFDITRGVSVALFVKHQGQPVRQAKVDYFDLWGLRGESDSTLHGGKHGWLLRSDIGSTTWIALHPSEPYFRFIPQDERLLQEYQGGIPVNKLFPINASTVTTARNDFAMSFEPQILLDRLTDLRDVSKPIDSVARQYELRDVSYWSAAEARGALKSEVDLKQYVKDYCYRPFDFRYVFYHPAIIERMRKEVMALMNDSNIAFLTHRPQSPGEFTFAYCTRMIGDQCVAANKSAGGGNSFQMPLYRVEQTASSLFENNSTSRIPNLDIGTLAALSKNLSLKFLPDGNGNQKENTFGPEDVFNYMYAVFHSPGYRSRYSEFLKIDFARLPLTSQVELFRSLARLGSELVALHLIEASKLDEPITVFVGGESPEVEKISYSENTVWIDKAKTTGFSGVLEAVWNFHIGGYQVCEKWLKDRKGRKLTKTDIEHYQKIVAAIGETIRIMKEIDEVIDAHGGWPLK